jgi:hypothetical protein
MRSPLRPRVAAGRQSSATASIPAPVGGWNARDPLAAMPPTDAVLMDNWFPTQGAVISRSGALNWVTGFSSQVLAIMPYNGLTGGKLFAATNTGIYDATTTGVVGAAVTPCTNGRWQSVNFSTVAGNYLIAVNGQDLLKRYNGTVWDTVDGAGPAPAITGLATSLLSNVCVAARRLWFCANNSLSAWYLPVASVGGALTEFPLGQVFTRGGTLTAIGTWTIDGGNGSDDFTVFMSSEGEVAVYRGIDPSTLDGFVKVGVYYIGAPLGKRCFEKFGGDLLILCQGGLFPLSKALSSASISRNIALSSKIDFAFQTAATTYGSNYGWDTTVFPEGNFLLVNVPVTSAYTEQYVMNTITGAWCRFLGWFAYSWGVYNRQIYFGSNNAVCLAWVGDSDFGAAIQCQAQQAYNYFGFRGKQKHFKLFRPLVSVTADVPLQSSMVMDYTEITASTSTLNASATNNSRWNAAVWDASTWADGIGSIVRGWDTTFSFEGYAAAYRLTASCKEASISWAATDFVFEVGGSL